MMVSRFVLLAVLLVVLVIGMWMMQPESNNAQTDAQNLRAMIEDLSARSKLMIFTFAEPIAPNLTIYETNGQDLRIGDDFVCISESWNDGRRFRCTPYSNVVSVSFVD